MRQPCNYAAVRTVQYAWRSACISLQIYADPYCFGSEFMSSRKQFALCLTPHSFLTHLTQSPPLPPPKASIPNYAALVVQSRSQVETP